MVCLMFSIAGILNSFFIGTLLDKYQCYRKALIGLCCASTVFLGLSAVGLPSRKFPLEAGIMVFTGASMIPVVTVCFSFAAELSYPVPESYSIGLMISSAQIFGFLLVSNVIETFYLGSWTLCYLSSSGTCLWNHSLGCMRHYLLSLLFPCQM